MRLVPLVLALALCLPAAPLAAVELQRLDATRTDLRAFVGAGRWTLVQLWTTDCIPCERQKPMLRAFHADHVDRDARVVGVALDGPRAIGAIERLVARHAASYPTLVAFDDVFERQFEALVGEGFRATPTYLMYAPDGSFAGAHVGPIERGALERLLEANEP